VAVAFEVRGELVGTVRAVPMRYGLTLAEKLLRQVLPGPGDLLDDSWEMGRLVLSPDFRSGQDALRRCLLLSLSFLHDRAPVANLHATCTPALARLYRRNGFEVIAREVPLHGTPKTYTLIHGPYDRVMASLCAGDEQADGHAGGHAIMAAPVPYARMNQAAFR
jgi:predicted GNAT family N-acyltransferase